jgi:Leucine-rich repeat (LRR) protein
MRQIYLIIALLYIFWLSACNNNSSGDPQPLSSVKQITGFQFTNTDNPMLVATITAVIDEAAKTIKAVIPYRTDVSALTPKIEFSTGTTISPTGVQDFNSPVIYTVTSENGSTAMYSVSVTVLVSQRDALISFYNANDGNTLGWDISSSDISVWPGVIVNDEGNVTSLNLLDKNLTSIHSEIGILSDLTFLELRSNNIASLPNEIGQLINLTFLGVNNNVITSIPTTIGKLGRLKKLYAYNNKLEAIPVEIGMLINLTQLSIGANKLTLIPTEIGLLTNLTWLNLYSNLLTSIPEEIGALTSLEILELSENNLTTIPQTVCDLETVHGTTLTIDAGVTCAP